jgi:hypothetical protein
LQKEVRFFFKEFQAIPLGNKNPYMEVYYENKQAFSSGGKPCARLGIHNFLLIKR